MPIHDSVFGDSGTIDWGGLIETGVDLARDIWGGGAGPILNGGGNRPQAFPQFPGAGQTGVPRVQQAGLGGALLGGGLGAGAIEMFSAWMESGGDTALFRPTAQSVRPVSRIDRVGPDGRCATWLLATPYRWKVRGTLVGGRKRHHHHYRKR